jgi:polyhydroxyalkanoate synthesis regulator phasin
MAPVMIVRMILKHREKLIAMQHRQEGAPGLVEEVAALRREVAALRETTTKFDVSFDAAVCRLEERVQTLENSRRGAGTASSGETESVLRRS